MKINVNVDVSDVLVNASRQEKEDLLEELKENLGEGVYDLDDKIESASSWDRQRIFDNLWEEGYGDKYIPQKDIKTDLESKRFMMDKADEIMYNYLIEKYKYFG